MLAGLSYKSTLAAIAESRFEVLLEAVPEEFRGKVEQWSREIQGRVQDLRCAAEAAFEMAPKADRKAFAHWVMGNGSSELRPVLFAMLDAKETEPIILQHLRRAT